MTNQETDAEAVTKILGEPVFAEYSDNAWKIRTNLIVAATVSIAVVFGDLHIDPDSQILGLKFRGLSDVVLTNGLIAVVSYLLVHFLWVSLDALMEWRLRVTGTRVAFVTTGKLGDARCDYPNNPRQSTLYNWWKGETRKIGNLTENFSLINEKLESWETRLKEKFDQGADALNISHTTHSLAEMREQAHKAEKAVAAAMEAIGNERIPMSLARFDLWYGLFLRSQNLRWLLIDFLAPILAGLYALALLIHR